MRQIQRALGPASSVWGGMGATRCSGDWLAAEPERYAAQSFLPTRVRTAMQTTVRRPVSTFRLRIVFSERGGAPRLELETPRLAVETCVWAALKSEQVIPSATYVLRTGSELIVHTKLLERDGKPLSRQRAGLLVAAVRRCLES